MSAPDQVDLVAQQLGLWAGLPVPLRLPLAVLLVLAVLVLVGIRTRDTDAEPDQLGPGTWRLQLALVNSIWLLPHPFHVRLSAPLAGPMANVSTRSWGLLWLCVDIRLIHLVRVN